MPLTRDDLDHMASHHYATGRRRKCSYAERLLLWGRCHPDAGTTVHYDPATLRLVIECPECETFIVDVATTGRGTGWVGWPIECPKCPEQTPVRPRYWHRSGELELQCVNCGEVFLAIPVLGDAEEN